MFKRLLTSLLAFIVVVAPAHAQTYNWSFVDDDTSATISGTISGLVQGNNNGTGLIITVLNAPSVALRGGGWNFIDTQKSGPAFVVSGGAVTFADAQYTRANGDYLYFGGFGGYSPELVNGEFSVDYITSTPNTFAAAAPEPASWAMMIGGFAVVGGAMRRRRKSAPVLVLAA